MMQERLELPGNFIGSYLIGEEEIEQVTEVLKAKSIFRYYGPNLLNKATKFESDIKMFFNIKNCLGLNSGTASLKCALKALKIGSGDEVIIPAYGFIATAGAVIACNAIPRFCDVDDSLNMDPRSLNKCISKKTKAIIPVHIMGQAANMDDIKNIASQHKIPIIEDVAQSFGGAYKGKYLGTIGEVGCFSFQENKILSTGEGGALITNFDKIYEKARIYHDQGGVRRENCFPSWNEPNSEFGENYRMSEITAAIGIAQLKKMTPMLERLKELKLLLRDNLANCDLNFRKSWDLEGDCSTAECFYIEDLNVRKILLKRLKEINAHGYYNSAVYENDLFNNINKKTEIFDLSCHVNKEIDLVGSCPNAENLSRQAIWIPINPLYTEMDIKYISSVIKNNVNRIN